MSGVGRPRWPGCRPAASSKADRVGAGEGRVREVRGRALMNGVPKQIVISERQISESLAESVGSIIEAVRVALEHTAAELAGDIVDKGIVLTGGGGPLSNLDLGLRHATGLPISIAEEPLTW